MLSYADVTAAILAGGFGTRLRSVIVDCPKVLARVRGRPFLEILLDQLAQAGVRHVVLCTGHGAEAVEEQFDGAYRDLRITPSREPRPLGTGGALRHALPLLDSNPVLVLNGDSYCRAELNAFLEWHTREPHVGSILLTEVSDASRYGSVDLDGEGGILSFLEKQEASGAGWINAGIYLLSQNLLRSIPEGQPVSLEREVFPHWVGRGLRGYRGGGKFIDIGTPASYASADEFFVTS